MLNTEIIGVCFSCDVLYQWVYVSSRVVRVQAECMSNNYNIMMLPE